MPITTITLCGYSGSHRLWAFNRMGSARGDLAGVRGLRFWKLLGTGQGEGYSLRPNFSRYGLLAVWEDRASARRFLDESRLFESYRRNADEVWTVTLRTLQTRGAWSGENPFASPSSGDPVTAGAHRGAVAVLTRATIRFEKLRAFWRSVPATSARLASAEGLIASIGTGEAPAVRPATLSFWRSEAALHAFAYDSSEHRDVIRRRRDESWYAEELFARFAPIASEGTWHGVDPLASLIERDVPSDEHLTGESQWTR